MMNHSMMFIIRDQGVTVGSTMGTVRELIRSAA